MVQEQGKAVWLMGSRFLTMGLAAVAAVSMTVSAGAQVVSPATADAQKATGQVDAPAGPRPQAGAQVASNPFPPVNLKNFTAPSPTREEVDSFLHSLWGYEENRIWSVAGIVTTPAPGVSKVIVLVGDKAQPGKIAPSVLYITPDGKHAIAGDVIDFGPKPFSAARTLLQSEATGPARGAQGKELELVEFADLQCPNCKAAQDTMDRLAQDFPQARVVFQPFPLTEPHPYAMRAATIGACVRKSKGDAAFFTYASDVYAHQAALLPATANDTLSAAVKAAGADPKATGECADTQAAKDEVTASMRLGAQLGVNSTPTLLANGRPLPLSGVPYDLLKRIIAYQANQDGLQVRVQPSLTTLK